MTMKALGVGRTRVRYEVRVILLNVNFGLLFYCNLPLQPWLPVLHAIGQPVWVFLKVSD